MRVPVLLGVLDLVGVCDPVPVLVPDLLGVLEGVLDLVGV